VKQAKACLFFAFKRNEIFASISIFASEAKTRTHPTLIKKENQTFLIYREIQSGAVAKSYMGKGFLIYEEMRKYFPIYVYEEMRKYFPI
jgi:hypothetical protein